MFKLVFQNFPAFTTIAGYLFVVIALFYIVDLFYKGYFNGVSTNFIQQIKTYKIWVLCGLIIIGIEIFYLDFPLSKWCKDNFNQPAYSFFDWYSNFAEGGCLGALIFFLILLADFLQIKQLSKILRVSFTALLSAGMLNTVLKCLFNRERPGIALQPLQFFHFFRSGIAQVNQLFYASNSMPSGHTIAIFAVITPFVIYFRQFWIKALLVIIALLICVARVYTLNHWLSDVTVAAILGVSIGVAVYRANNKSLV